MHNHTSAKINLITDVRIGSMSVELTRTLQQECQEYS